MTTHARRGWLGVMALVATAIVATGCGSSSSSSSSSSAPASAGSSSSSSSSQTSTAAPASGGGGAGQASVTNYLTYVGGKAGKANASLPPVYIGWVNQQGGQQQIGPLATNGAQSAIKYINTELGGVGGHPVALKTCYIRSAEEEGTTCGQKFLADKSISVIDEGAVAIGGLSPKRLSMLGTLLASVIAGGIGILAASITQLDTSTLPLQIVPALAAALLARFTSFGIACAAGIALGIIDSLIEYVTSLSWFPTSGGSAWPGVQELVVFILIVLFMYLRGARLPSRGELVERRLPEAPRPRRLAVTAPALAAVCAVALVVLPFDFREALVNSMIGTLIALSLVVITGFVGEISVVQLTLAGVSGFTISHLAVNAGIGFPLAPLLGAGVALVLGLITAASALRVRGVSLAVVTLAAVVAITNFGFLNTTWGGGQTGSPVPEPRLLGLDLGPRAAFRGLDGNLPSPVFGWLVLVVTVALCVLVAVLRRGTLGQRMLAVRSNERAAAAAAIDPRAVKLIAFGISSVIAGLAGALYAYNFGSVSADRFDPFTALSLIAFAYAGGITLISGAVFAGLISTEALFPYALDKWFGINGNWFLLFGGAILIITLIQNPEGVAGAFYKRTHKRAAVHPPESGPPAEVRSPPTLPALGVSGTARARPDRIAGPAGVPVLSVRGLSVAFGGVRAVDGVDLEVREGELVGLIGPTAPARPR